MTDCTENQRARTCQKQSCDSLHLFILLLASQNLSPSGPAPENYLFTWRAFVCSHSIKCRPASRQHCEFVSSSSSSSSSGRTWMSTVMQHFQTQELTWAEEKPAVRLSAVAAVVTDWPELFLHQPAINHSGLQNPMPWWELERNKEPQRAKQKKAAPQTSA